MNSNDCKLLYQRIEFRYYDKKTDEQRKEFERSFVEYWKTKDQAILSTVIDAWNNKNNWAPNNGQLQYLYNEIKFGKLNNRQGGIIQEENGVFVWSENMTKVNQFKIKEQGEIEAWAKERKLPYPCLTKEHIQAYVDYNKTLIRVTSIRGRSFLKEIPEAKPNIPTKADVEAAKIRDQTNKDFAEELMQTDESLPF